VDAVRQPRSLRQRRVAGDRRELTGGRRLHGRAAIVTGASRGIGLAIAEALVASGDSVVLTSRQQDAADTAAASLGTERAAGYAAHATDEEAAEACVAFAVETFGSIDIPVNNAGTNPAFGPVVDQDKARFIKNPGRQPLAPALSTGLAWRAWMGEHGGGRRQHRVGRRAGGQPDAPTQRLRAVTWRPSRSGTCSDCGSSR
jgi:NAD(P)-dependent dehydrogenase (short-subunit alcohol dehydrogenase family)